MKKVKIKRLLVFFGIVIGLCFAGYRWATPLTRNTLKKELLHSAHILNSKWSKSISKANDGYQAKFNSPTLLVDDIFGSMKGPATSNTFLLNEKEEELYWITGLNVSANVEDKNQEDANDFVCHVNFDHSQIEHFSRFDLEERINLQIPQLITLTKGGLDFDFPEGFGYPIFSNEKIVLGTQALNLNDKSAFFKIDYDFVLSFQKDKEKRLKPLYMRYVILSLPYDENDLEHQDRESMYSDSKVRCVITRGNNLGFNGVNAKGEPITSFWKVPKGKHTYRSAFEEYIKLDTIMTLHKINSHVHPYSESIELRDITADSTVFKSLVTNKQDKIGLREITSFSSVKGVKLYPDHKYEIVQEVNNTSEGEIEMMGSMFLYFYDHKLDKKLRSIL
ncbi:hypothetical protein [Seonamhaeicola marinus]|uniref:Uncharacterized protein n=1 Tax=Seonamhaeicola marinus TaxID=1912246 RepID=A0A5D0HT75_9FLAO|nr:hypothetical protein [Seonamhaeicola marinus]TYA74485.1 hypothetical protein FUA24_14270 [Seonamhaeicola marinus]